MKDLIERLQKEHNMSEEEAQKVLHTITNYIKEKFPMVSGAVDGLFNSSGDEEKEDWLDG